MTSKEIVLDETIEETSGSISIVTEKKESVKVTPNVLKSIQESVKIYLNSNPEFLRQIIREALNEEEKEFVFKTPTKSEAKSQIVEYIQNHVGCKTSDIIFETYIDPELVMTVLNELKAENKVRSKIYEPK